jgi:hypothetical protein
VLARVRQSASDIAGAVDSLRRACDIYGRVPRQGHRRARSLVALAQLLVESGSREEGARLSMEARRLADQLGSPALAALALSNIARAEVLAGRSDSAEGLYRDAARLAAEAGDADWHEQWSRAARGTAAA